MTKWQHKLAERDFDLGDELLRRMEQQEGPSAEALVLMFVKWFPNEDIAQMLDDNACFYEGEEE